MLNTKLYNKLEQAERYFEDMLAVIPGRVYWKNLKGEFQGCNDLQAKNAGLSSRNEIIGLTDFDMPWRNEADLLQKIDLEVTTLGKAIVIEEKAKIASGKEAIWLSRKEPLKNVYGQTIGVIGTSIDITELKSTISPLVKIATTAEKQLCEVITTYAATIAHSQRTPLACITLMANFFETTIPILLAVYEEAQAKGLTTANLLTPHHLEYLKSNLAKSQQQCVVKVNTILDNNLEKLKCAVKIHLGMATSADLMECNINDSLLLIKSSQVILEKEQHLVHIEKCHNFKFRGNDISLNQIITQLLVNALMQIRANGQGAIFIQTEEKENWNLLRFIDTSFATSSSKAENLLEHDSMFNQDNGLAFAKATMQLFGGAISVNVIKNNHKEFILSFPKI